MFVKMPGGYAVHESLAHLQDTPDKLRLEDAFAPSSSSRAGPGHRRGTATDTEFISLNGVTGAAGGAAMAGGGTYLYCKSKCPGGTGMGKMFGGIKDYITGAEDKDEEVLEGDDLDVKRITNIRRRTCHANCKVDALLAAAAGAAAGGIAGNMAKQRGIGQNIGQSQQAPYAPGYAQHSMGLDEWTTGPAFALLQNSQLLEPEELRKKQRWRFLSLNEENAKDEAEEEEQAQNSKVVAAGSKWSGYFEYEEPVLSETEPEPELPSKF